MVVRITRVEIRFDQDTVYARQRTRVISELLGFDRTDQTRLCTSVSEIGRNAIQYGGGGVIDFEVDPSSKPQTLTITVKDQGKGIPDLETILEGRYVSKTGLGKGIIGTKKLMDFMSIQSEVHKGTTISFGKFLPLSAELITPAVLRKVSDGLAATQSESSPLDEIRNQNVELLAALEQIREREEELSRVNLELTEINKSIFSLNGKLKNNAEQLQKSEKMLLARNKELKDFAHTISHDLKTPLRGIAGYAQELERKHISGLSDRGLFCVKQINNAAHNLDDLIEDLLFFSRLDIDIPTISPVSLKTAIDKILENYKQPAAEFQMEIRIQINDLNPTTWERGLTQVITNLVDNAIKYSRRSSHPVLEIKTIEKENTWILCVTDNGIGFDMKFHDRIFGLFERLVTTDEFEGTGAGLAISKKVLEKIGGSIRAESSPGNGSTFFVELPYTIQAENPDQVIL